MRRGGGDENVRWRLAQERKGLIAICKGNVTLASCPHAGFCLKSRIPLSEAVLVQIISAFGGHCIITSKCASRRVICLKYSTRNGRLSKKERNL